MLESFYTKSAGCTCRLYREQMQFLQVTSEVILRPEVDGLVFSLSPQFLPKFIGKSQFQFFFFTGWILKVRVVKGVVFVRIAGCVV